MKRLFGMKGNMPTFYLDFLVNWDRSGVALQYGLESRTQCITGEWPLNNRIMIVDGSKVSREVLARIVEDVIEGAEVNAVSNGADALKQLQQEDYDLVTTALMLPDMDGLDLCRHLRASAEHSFTPLIVISGDADQRLLKEGFAAGVTDYFDKSRGYPAFGKFIKSFCQRNRGLVGNVLYVEDSVTAATVIRRMMESHGLKVTHVASAEAALELLHRSTDTEGVEEEEPAATYDALITDFQLRQEMSGGDLLHAIRARYSYSRQELPVLMITGSEDIQTQVEAFHSGANDFVNKPLVEEILMARIHSLLLIKQQYDALEQQASKMEELATRDSLTGVRNRHHLLEHGEAMYAASENQPFWVMIIDIDHFKKINDNQGHLVGDQVLSALGAMLQRLLHKAMVVRFGGEEFAVLLPGCKRKKAQKLAERVRSSAESLRPSDVRFSVSIGMAGSKDHPNVNLNTLIGLADKALYASKEAGRNKVSYTSAEGELILLPQDPDAE